MDPEEKPKPKRKAPPEFPGEAGEKLRDKLVQDLRQRGINDDATIDAIQAAVSARGIAEIARSHIDAAKNDRIKDQWAAVEKNALQLNIQLLELMFGRAAP